MQRIPLTDLRNELADGFFTQQHREKIERLRDTYHHSIRRTGHQVIATKCFAYAFGLTDTPTRELMDRVKGFADSRFIRWLLETRRLTDVNNPDHQQCIALYFLEQQAIHCKHAAIRRLVGRMESKWGRYLVFEHTTEEVPSNYGDFLRFVTKPSDEQAHELFDAYIKCCESLPSWARPFGN